MNTKNKSLNKFHLPKAIKLSLIVLGLYFYVQNSEKMFFLDLIIT